MKNKIIYIILILSLAFGCKKIPLGDEFLEKAPGVDVTIDTVFKNLDNAVRLLWSAYRTVRYGLPAHDQWGESVPEYLWAPSDLMYRNLLESLTDECQSYDGTGGAMRLYYPGIYDATAAGGTNVRYSFIKEYAWLGIRMAYTFIENIDRVPDADAATKHELKAEAYMVIACLYADMYRNLGGIPWLSHSAKITDNFSSIKRLTAQASCDSIVALCDKVSTVLPWKIEDPEQWDGRFTRAAALGLKARVLLFNASPVFNDAVPYLDGTASQQKLTWHGGYDANRWKLAMDAAHALITESEATGDYKIYYNPSLSYRQNFQNAYYLRGNGEVIISIRDRFRSPTSGQTYYFYSSSQWGSGLVTDDCVKMFPMANGKSITDPTSGYDSLNPYIKSGVWYRDPRLYETALVNGDTYRGRSAELWIGGRERTTAAGTNAATGYPLRKFLLDRDVNTSMGSIIQWPYLRMAEIYLSFAEASNEFQNGPDAEAYRCINIVRNRVGIGNLTPGLSKDQFRDAVIHERAIELAFEEVHFFDLVRWKREGDFIKKLHGMDVKRSASAPYTYTYTPFITPLRAWQKPGGWSPKWYFEAFPVAEVNKGYGLVQNPGWE